MPTNGNDGLKNKYGGVDESKRPASGSGEVLHQRRRLPQSPAVMAVGGFALIASIAYFTLYAKPKKGTSPNQIAAAVAGDEPPRK
ncbi:hypothetical protein KFK09_028550 [Dendrobium nobile]|nr:hypothetical protein KFK09_028550 [Dendrobium nobile]